MRVVITGATGLVGRALVRRLAAPIVLTRSPERAAAALPGVVARRWDPEAEPAPAEALAGADAVLHLAGEPIAAGRWTAERRRRIRDSRVIGTRRLVEGLGALDRRPAVLVSASAVGYYGDRGDEVLDERAAPGDGFLAEICAEWEAAAAAAVELGIRVVCVRIGVVLASGGGALAAMLTPFRLGLGGRLGGGRQWMSWVHVDDVAGLWLHAARTGSLRGPMNAVGPAPVTNADFTRALAGALHRPALLPVPSLALRAAFGDLAELLTASQRVLPVVAQGSGYAFEHPSLSGALAAALGRGAGAASSGERT